MKGNRFFQVIVFFGVVALFVSYRQEILGRIESWRSLVEYNRRMDECKKLACGRGMHCNIAYHQDHPYCEKNDPNCNGVCSIGAKCDVDTGQCLPAQ